MHKWNKTSYNTGYNTSYNINYNISYNTSYTVLDPLMIFELSLLIMMYWQH